jgi:hypothetical protein
MTGSCCSGETHGLASLAGLVLSEECVEIMINNKDFLHEVCLKQLISKVLSYGILAGSIGFKLPQVSPPFLALSLNLCSSLRSCQFFPQRKLMELVSFHFIVRSVGSLCLSACFSLNLISFLMQLPMVMLLIAYNYLQSNPFLTYGENIFVCFQNFILVGLLWTYMQVYCRPTPA